MKSRKARLAPLGLAVVGTMALAGVGGQGVFAANEPYDIVYSGGTALGSNGNVTPLEEGEGFQVLLNPNSSDVQGSADGSWSNGYVHWGSSDCAAVKYIKIPLTGDRTETLGNFSFTETKGDLVETVTINKVTLSGIPTYYEKDANGNDDTSKPMYAAIYVNLATGSVGTMGRVYSGATEGCKNNTSQDSITTIKYLYPNETSEDGKGTDSTTDGGKIFIELNIELKKNGQTFKSGDLYFGITDIDRAQSFKILSPDDDKFSSGNLFAIKGAVLQPSDVSGQNIFVSSGNYIYSEYPPFDISGDGVKGASVFSKLSANDGAADIDVVFGYGASANSSTRFYHKTYTVQYKSINGTITGITDEDVISGANPTGSKQAPNTHYEFEYWTADVDVTLKDGTEIKAGEEISMEQIANVVVDKNIIFTAHNKTFVVEYKSDDHGKITGTTKENRNSNEHPGGSTQEADANYEFAYWICDKDVELTDGTKIAAGQPITDEQLTQVKINQNLVFTAIHKTKPNTPNTGTFTKDGDNVVQVISLILATLASAGFAGSYIVKRKKSIVKFNK